MATETTGNPSAKPNDAAAKEPTPLEPWKRAWNDVTDFGNKVVNSVSEAISGPKKPWEQNWGGSMPSSKQIAPEPSGGSAVDTFMKKLENVESKGVATAKNPKSSATGLHQFIDSTWQEEVKALGKNYTLEDRKDPEKSREVFRAFTDKNEEKAVSDLGRKPQAHELYMYHLLGRNGAGDILKASADKPAIRFVSAKQARANKNIFYDEGGDPRTVKEVLTTFREKFK